MAEQTAAKKYPQKARKNGHDSETELGKIQIPPQKNYIHLTLLKHF